MATDATIASRPSKTIGIKDKSRTVHLLLHRELPTSPSEYDSAILPYLLNTKWSVRPDWWIVPRCTPVILSVDRIDELSTSARMTELFLSGFGLLTIFPSLVSYNGGPKRLSHRPVGELTNTGVGAMGLKRGRPVQFHRPLVGPQKGRLLS